MTKQVHITEHALFRYLERVRGFSFEREKAEIRKICGTIQNGTVKHGGCHFEIVNGRLVTITPPSVGATKRAHVMNNFGSK